MNLNTKVFILLCNPRILGARLNLLKDFSQKYQSHSDIEIECATLDQREMILAERNIKSGQ